MTKEPKQDPKEKRDQLVEEAAGEDRDDAPSEGGPWAKTSSGDADSVTQDDD
jgi:hypothetical protein